MERLAQPAGVEGVLLHLVPQQGEQVVPQPEALWPRWRPEQGFEVVAEARHVLRAGRLRASEFGHVLLVLLLVVARRDERVQLNLLDPV